MNRILRQHKSHPKNQQQGFVLVLALVLLAVMTLIGVSSMDSANMEMKATANAHQHHVAFNAVQSVLEYALSSDPVATAKISYQYTGKTPQLLDHTVANASSLQAAVLHVGCTVGVGSSLEEGKSFSYNFYNINGTGANKTKTASSFQTQGVRYPAAACPKK
ncbi:MAG: hypothetical protein KAT12_06260 [Gammaproteobacteria bacterium]|nr:hypothetical protein [Gammaproteobacteria bacterium]